MKRKPALFLGGIVASVALISLSVFALSDTEHGDEANQPEPDIAKITEEAAVYGEETEVDVTDEEYSAQENKCELLVEEPALIFIDGSAVENYFDIDSVIDAEYLTSQNATLTLKEVMEYADYLERFDQEPLTSIALDCKVWVLRVHYPDGFETRRGLYKNAAVTGVYDAKTGYYHGFSLTGECDEINLPPRND